MLLFSTNAYASHFLECNGLVTLQSDATELANDIEHNKNYRHADIFIHDHTFKCKGHDDKINIKGLVRNSQIEVDPINTEALKEGTHLRVEYSYVDSLLPDGVVSKNSDWRMLDTVQAIPTRNIPVKSAMPRPSPTSPEQGIDLFTEESLWQQNELLSLNNNEFDLTPFLDKGVNYHSAFFQIVYPAEFNAKPLDPIFLGHTPEQEPDSQQPKYVNTHEAFFTSADGLVEFYAYVIDSANTLPNYLNLTDDEIRISSKTAKDRDESKHLNYIGKAWVTIKAKDDSYFRSYIHTRACHDNRKSVEWHGGCETRVVGIKYPNIESYAIYRDAFSIFNRTLRRTTAFEYKEPM